MMSTPLEYFTTAFRFSSQIDYFRIDAPIHVFIVTIFSQTGFYLNFIRKQKGYTNIT
ncbi:MAG: hypothetical protein HC787_01520 [Nostocaceae cyanobacterium CSU_2_110]|nr:hypothetical protein [Nostocaceae cyanobacterium CSU_2_110]